jgi:hypothetical protein
MSGDAIKGKVPSSGTTALASLMKLLEGLVQDCCRYIWRASAGYCASFTAVNWRSKIIKITMVRNFD